MKPSTCLIFLLQVIDFCNVHTQILTNNTAWRW